MAEKAKTAELDPDAAAAGPEKRRGRQGRPDSFSSRFESPSSRPGWSKAERPPEGRRINLFEEKPDKRTCPDESAA